MGVAREGHEGEGETSPGREIEGHEGGRRDQETEGVSGFAMLQEARGTQRESVVSSDLETFDCPLTMQLFISPPFTTESAQPPYKLLEINRTTSTKHQDTSASVIFTQAFS